MGVPRLCAFIKRNFAQYIYRPLACVFSVDYMYIDANALLHLCAQQVFQYGSFKRMMPRIGSIPTDEEKTLELFNLFFDKIVSITNMIPFTEILYIAIDGTPPMAKQSQQRQRRFVAARDRPSGEKGAEVWDSNKLSTGTLFMHELAKFMNYRIRKEMCNPKSRWYKKKVIFSSHSIPGEGEHKLLEYFRSLSIKEQQSKRHMFVGPDGDLIMLTLASQSPNMYLLREDMKEKDVYDLFMIGGIRGKLPDVLSQLFSIHKGIRTLDDVVHDFILIGFFVGNDFLPKVKMFYYLEDGLTAMFQSYSKTSQNGRTLFLTHVKNGTPTINLDGFIAFVRDVSSYEIAYLNNQVSKKVSYYHKGKYDEDGAKKFEDKTLLSCVKDGTFPPVLDYNLYEQKYYEKEFGKGLTRKEMTQKKHQMCQAYLQGINFVFLYYCKKIPAWRWYYNYHYPPLMTTFYEYLVSRSSRDLLNDMALDKSKPVLPFVQLLCILPPSSKSLLPCEFHHLFDEKSPLVDIYPKEFEVDYEGKTQDHEGVVLLPFADIQKVEKEYSKVKLRYDYVRNTRGAVHVFVHHDAPRRYQSEYGELTSTVAVSRQQYYD